MAEEGFYLDRDDRDQLRGVIRQQKVQINNPRVRDYSTPEPAKAPEVYVVVPTCGENIPARSGDTPGMRENCCLLTIRKDASGSGYTLEPVEDSDGNIARVTVFNIYDTEVPAMQPPDEFYLRAEKDKFGSWLVEKYADGTTTTTTSSTTTTPNIESGTGVCEGEPEWTWDAASFTWTLTADPCSETTTTTTTSTSSTTTSEIACLCPPVSTTTSSSTTSTSSTTTSSATCVPLYPLFCGEEDGDCTTTFCSKVPNVHPDCGQSTSTSTTSSSSSTTTTTSTTTTSGFCDCETTTTTTSTTTSIGPEDCAGSILWVCEGGCAGDTELPGGGFGNWRWSPRTGVGLMDPLAHDNNLGTQPWEVTTNCIPWSATVGDAIARPDAFPTRCISFQPDEPCGPGCGSYLVVPCIPHVNPYDPDGDGNTSNRPGGDINAPGNGGPGWVPCAIPHGATALAMWIYDHWYFPHCQNQCFPAYGWNAPPPLPKGSACVTQVVPCSCWDDEEGSIPGLPYPTTTSTSTTTTSYDPCARCYTTTSTSTTSSSSTTTTTSTTTTGCGSVRCRVKPNGFGGWVVVGEDPCPESCPCEMPASDPDDYPSCTVILSTCTGTTSSSTTTSSTTTTSVSETTTTPAGYWCFGEVGFNCSDSPSHICANLFHGNPAYNETSDGGCAGPFETIEECSENCGSTTTTTSTTTTSSTPEETTTSSSSSTTTTTSSTTSSAPAGTWYCVEMGTDGPCTNTFCSEGVPEFYQQCSGPWPDSTCGGACA